MLDNIFSHLAGRHTIRKHDIDLFESTIFQIGDVQETTHCGDHTQATEDKSNFAIHITLVRVDHVWHNDVHDNTKDGLGGGRHGSSLSAQRWRGSFTEKDERDGTNADLVEEGPDHGESCLGPASTLSWDHVKDTDEQVDNAENSHAPDENSPSSETIDDGPGEHSTNDTTSGNSNAEIEGTLGGETSQLEEVGGKAEDKDDSDEVLTHEDSAGNYSAKTICTMDKVGPLGLLRFQVLGHGHLDSHELCLDVRPAAVEALEGGSGIVDPFMTDEVPRRFDGEWKPNGQESFIRI